MKASLTVPSSQQLADYLATRKHLPFTYSERSKTSLDIGELRLSTMGKKYDLDESRIYLGEGLKVFERAKKAIRQWQMFPAQWSRVYPDKQSIEAGRQVVILFRIFGCWLWVSNEIVYSIDEEKRFGFAYGTLRGHVEAGEELFLVEIDESGRVWYIIKAFSRPAYWYVRLGYPFARSRQKHFVKDSMQQMKAFANPGHHPIPK